MRARCSRISSPYFCIGDSFAKSIATTPAGRPSTELRSSAQHSVHENQLAVLSFSVPNLCQRQLQSTVRHLLRRSACGLKFSLVIGATLVYFHSSSFTEGKPNCSNRSIALSRNRPNHAGLLAAVFAEAAETLPGNGFLLLLFETPFLKLLL